MKIALTRRNMDSSAKNQEARKKHVLLADDEAHTRLTLALILKRAGFEVTTVADGMDALNKTIENMKSSNPFDLLVIDIQMPSLSGLELLKEIEKLKLKFPILLISGYRNGDITGALASGGPVVYAEKPFNPNEFLKYVTKVFAMFNKDEQDE